MLLTFLLPPVLAISGVRLWRQVSSGNPRGWLALPAGGKVTLVAITVNAAYPRTRYTSLELLYVVILGTL